MIKRLLATCLLLFVFIGSKAQPYGNEWISYSQKYYKIKVAVNGVYRIDSATLAAAGIDLAVTDPHNFQLFNKGIQQKIHVEGEADNVFNSGDFIEFYGEKNDGSLDALLYRNSSFVPNPYYSLVNDTAVYFLTVGMIPGSRMLPSNDTLFSAYGPPVNYFFKEEIRDFHSDYYFGATDNVGGTDARYTPAEGWFDGNTLELGGVNLYSGLNTSLPYLFGPDAVIRTVAVGASRDNSFLGTGILDHHLKIEFGPANTLLADTTFDGYSANMFVKAVPVSLLGASSTDFRFTSITDPGFTYNRTAISYINVRYPHLTDMEGKSSFLFYVPDNQFSSKSFFNLVNFSGTGQAYVYDLSTGKRMNVTQSGANYKVIVPNTSSEKKCFMISESGITAITSVLPVTASGQFSDYSAMAMDSAFLIVTHKSLMTSANDYKLHRSSAAGGMHQVVIADIEELYDQFAYGIVKSPLAVRGFSDYLLDNFPTAPHNLFLLGKSVHLNYCRQDGSNYSSCLVPSFGYPSSDNLLTAGLNGTNLSPAIPTGRLSANTNAEVTMYLDKMIQYEALTTPEEWMKYVLHFGGGSTLGEQASFKNFLRNYKDTIEGVKFGGKVIKEFFKTTSAPITINSSDTLRDLINNGVTLMTFFGHASGTGFDQSIDNWNTYNPAPGRYPFLLANSCYAGDFHASGSGSSSETYTFLTNNGVIGYLGSVGLGVPYALNYFSSEFYAQIARKNYNRSVGSSIQKTIAAVEPIALIGGDSLLRQTCYEMNLQGDPALKLHTHEKPDYAITNSDVYFDMVTDLDSFTVYAVRRNLGMAVNDSIVDQLIRILPNGDTARYLVNIKAPKYKDTISFKVPFDFVNGTGLNKIIVSLDWFGRVDELNENNNTTAEIDLLVTGSSIVPVYPYEFAIIPNDTVTLRASTANPLATLKTYRFQIDTTDLFNSPLMQQGLVSSVGGVVNWKPSMNFTNRTVYYWRVSPDSIDATGYNWRESSFQYINGKRGWEQAHFFQFKNDEYQYVKFNRPQRRFDFANDVISVFASTGIYPYTGIENITYKLDGYVRSVYTCIDPGSGFTFVAINPITGIPLISHHLGGTDGTYGDYHCAPASWDAIEFYDSDTVWQNKMATFLNGIPNGFHVIGYSEGHPKFGTYNTALNTAFQSIGAVDMNALPDSLPYVIWGTKGITPPGGAIEIQGTSFSSVPTLNTSFTTNWAEGYIASPVIGPAASWDSLSWDFHAIDGAFTQDSITIRLIGIDTAGIETVLADFDSATHDIPNLGSLVPVATYPKIRLKAFMKDDSLHTPPQLERWQVIYTPVPEAAINAAAGYSFANDTLEEGDNINIHLPIQNISEFAFTQDSLLVTYWLEDANRVNHPLPSKLKKKPFNPFELIIDTININTTDYQGNTALWVEVNPVGQTRSQQEQYHFNNIVRIPFYTNTDRANPLLDVTFDGIHILNNDIVSAKPNVLIRLKDENKFLALNDTNDFKVFIKTPSAALAQRVYFGSIMSFSPAVLPDNSCKINYTPVLFEDGTYQLLVQAKDKSDNQSGAIDYKINFEVVNRSTITEVMNYPNPFSTSTRFVFTLTGSEEPTNFKIQIMTITGKVVREIYQDELGPIHIGRNITEFAWDGKDEFGDQLANGVYLYHVITRINGSDIEKKETSADQYFKKGWGKMYLMR